MKLLARLQKAKAENPARSELLQVRIDEETLSQLECIAEKIQKSRSWVVTELIKAASEELEE